jgi:phosphohistidine phosphatase
MRQLTLIRHAKSSHDQPGQRDFYRSLNERGYADAPQMGRYLRSALQWKPDSVICSPATRALSTARLLLEAADYDSLLIQQKPEIYEATSDAILEVIHGVPDSVSHLCLVGHNPGMENLANLLVGARAITGFVTCGVAMLELDSKTWAQAGPGCGRLVKFLQPRSLWAGGGD